VSKATAKWRANWPATTVGARNGICAAAVVAALALLVILYAMAIGPYWRISPDSVTYVSAGVSFASGNGYRQAGEPVLLFPPVTSLMFGIALKLFPGSYLALNALVAAFALLAHAACFMLFRQKTDSLRASIPVLLSLGSILIFRNSTLLLSDIFYMFFSIVALAVAEYLAERESSWMHHLMLALIVWVACMTRIVGIALVAAVVANGLLWPRRQGGRRSLLILMTLVALAVALWEVRSLRLGTSYLKLALQNEPWVEQAGYASPLGLLRKVYHNLDDYLAIGDVLTNDIFLGQAATPAYLGLLARGLALALFCLGLLRSLGRRSTVTDLYCAIYLLVIGVYYTYIDLRFFVPIAPLMFYYALVGGQAVAERAGHRLRPVGQWIAWAALLVYVVCFLRAGVAEMRRAIPREHSSPFGDYPIKYPQNYDLQRLAMWLRDNSAPDEAYVTQHVDMTGYFTERPGYYFPFSSDPARLLDLLTSKRVRYVLADKTKLEVQKFLLPAIQAYPEKFRLVQDEEKASLYEFRLQP
jgi:hypothetical protein